MLNSPFLVFAKSWVQSNNTKTLFGKVKSSILSIVIGCLISIVIMYILKANGFNVFFDILTSSFKTVKLQATMLIVALLVVSALANAIAFKSGLFNIGVSGQIFFSGLIMIIFGTKVITNAGYVGGFLLLLIAMITGALVSAFIGFLKAYFNIHEVISSILLNWALFFLGKVIMNAIPNFYQNNNPQSGTLAVEDGMNFFATNSNYGIVIFMVFGFLCALVIGFVFWKTRFGFNAKAVGMNQNASMNAGINKRRQVIFSMGLSGLIAGLAGVILFMFQGTAHISFEYIKSNDIASILPYGFDGIAISLISYNNPLAIIPTSVFFGALKSGAPSLSLYGLDQEVYSLIIGLIMYFSAISVIFIRFKIFKMIFTYIKLQRVKTILQIRASYRNDLANLKKNRQELTASFEHKASKTTKGQTERQSLKHVVLSSYQKMRGEFLKRNTTFHAYLIVRKKYRDKVRVQKIKVVNGYDRLFSRYDTLVRTQEFAELKSSIATKKANYARERVKVKDDSFIGRALVKSLKFIYSLKPLNFKDRTDYSKRIEELLEKGDA